MTEEIKKLWPELEWISDQRPQGEDCAHLGEWRLKEVS